jgi:hypothetical protein
MSWRFNGEGGDWGGGLWRGGGGGGGRAENKRFKVKTVRMLSFKQLMLPVRWMTK